MKKITFFILLLAFVQIGKAQQNTTAKIVIKTPMAVCEYCKSKIEAYIGGEYGVVSVNVDIKKQTTTVVYITDRTNDENLKTALSNLGFDADDVPAEPTAMRYLAQCCQKKLSAADSAALQKPSRRSYNSDNPGN
ncbi:heavy-metal-associated domain-containing protein [Ferruginibacter albus]|uniref:heavy-metal-associated domain-containing protein n=1 Tax=Ferruginibacter albus TaxID=2875540 RepID=UPI001CC4EA3C|nr:heavy-metal-associated domain-containing protein [Ferruginibacter albus]UAY51001.1 heavy-metal-associated domain-containing protein [Ferruginibacter albus]